MRKFWLWFIGLFFKVKKLSIAQKYYSVEGKLVDVIEKSYVTKKIYRLSPKHIKIKTIEGKNVDVHTNEPMDYTVEDV